MQMKSYQFRCSPPPIWRQLRQLVLMLCLAALAPSVALSCTAPQCCVSAGQQGQDCPSLAGSSGVMICHASCLAVLPVAPQPNLPLRPQPVVPVVVMLGQSIDLQPDFPPPKPLI